MGPCHLLVHQPIRGQLTDGFGTGVSADDVGRWSQCGLGVESHFVLFAEKKDIDLKKGYTFLGDNE